MVDLVRTLRATRYLPVQDHPAKMDLAVTNHLRALRWEECRSSLRMTFSCVSASLRQTSVIPSKNKNAGKIKPKLTWNPRTAGTSRTSGEWSHFFGGAFLVEIESFPRPRIDNPQIL